MDRWQSVVVGLCLVVLGLECIFLLPRSGGSDGGDSSSFVNHHHHRILVSKTERSVTKTVSVHQKTLVNVGLPRTGSNALHAYAQCHGWSNIHLQDDCRASYKACSHCFADNLQQGRQPPWKNCARQEDSDHVGAAAFFQVDVEAAQPYSWFLPQYGAVLPAWVHKDVVWLLTLRSNATVWAESVLHWHSVTHRLRHALQLRQGNAEHIMKQKSSNVTVGLPQPVTYEQVVQGLEASLERIRDVNFWYRQRQQFMDAYEAHIKNVQQTAETYHIPLITIVLDDASETYWQSQLTAYGWKESITMTKHCWQGPVAAQRLDTDWQDFTFSL